jgi:hypothetical protein
MQQQPAWKSVYSNGPTTHRHKQASRPSSTSDGGGNRPQSKQQHVASVCQPCPPATAVQPCSSATPEEQHVLGETLGAASNHSCSQQQHLACSRATMPGRGKHAVHSNPSTAPGATGQQALTSPHAAQQQQQQQQQPPVGISSRPATAVGSASPTSSIHPASTRRLSSPSGQAVQARPTQQHALSPYLAPLPLTARYAQRQRCKQYHAHTHSQQAAAVKHGSVPGQKHQQW